MLGTFFHFYNHTTWQRNNDESFEIELGLFLVELWRRKKSHFLPIRIAVDP